jgi:hypothetical protein
VIGTRMFFWMTCGAPTHFWHGNPALMRHSRAL